MSLFLSSGTGCFFQTVFVGIADLEDPLDTLNGFCWDCREDAAREARKAWCIAPLHKSNYMLITNRQDLAGLNNKGGLVR